MQQSAIFQDFFSADKVPPAYKPSKSKVIERGVALIEALKQEGSARNEVRALVIAKYLRQVAKSELS